MSCPRPRRHDERTHVDRNTASEIEWVMNRAPNPLRWNSAGGSSLSRSRVISSRAPNGSSNRNIAGSISSESGQRGASSSRRRAAWGTRPEEPSRPTRRTLSATQRAARRGRGPAARRTARRCGAPCALQQRRILEHVAEAAPVDRHRPARRHVEARGDARRRRLAAARRPDDGDELAGATGGDVLATAWVVGERLGDVGELEHGGVGALRRERCAVRSVVAVSPQCMIMPPVTLPGRCR